MTSGSMFHQVTVNSFFTISDDELLHLVHSQFTPELDRLKRAYSISDEKTLRPTTKSPSQILYGEQYDEVNRTLTSVLALRWLYNNQYETFVGTQPDSVVLTRQSFEWMRDFVIKETHTVENLYALVTSVVINDLGKDPQLADDCFSKTGKDISSLNHDLVLIKAVGCGLISCLEILSSTHKEDVIRGLVLGAEFNFGQLAQAENAPYCLQSLHKMRGHTRAFALHFVEQLLDISGAAGHEDWTCAKKLIEPVFSAYQNVHEVAMRVISEELGLREGYDLILIRRNTMLRNKGFDAIPDVQKLGNDENRALLRLFCMGGVSDVQTAKLYHSSWEGLDYHTKESLILSLNIDGSTAEPAVQPTYMPAMLGVGVDVAGSDSREEKILRLQSMLRYLARVMNQTDMNSRGRAAVFERSVLSVITKVVQTEAYRKDPFILDRTEMPEIIAEEHI